ncbi:hypothetical protein MNB_SV-13-1817 [hydrothermal vent metagenome]|uniref:PD-(D/E)XK nuclease superfamily protein n=1 Tax=hydrothermal vent metagenome TaxID=652676 RepID=A0A1W1BLB7_9ZZZZ
MNKPSLFRHATKELSQDAFLAWIFEYADKQYIGEVLHDCSMELLQKLFKKHQINFPINKSISLKVKKQETFYVNKKKRSIDLLCFIDDEYILLIEDKINTSDGEEKLNAYREYLEKEYSTYKIIAIYFKTGFQLVFTQVHNALYKEFLRDDFLAVLVKYEQKISNDIFQDYYQYLNNIESQILEYKNKEIKDWNGYQWQGFYKELHKQLGKGNGSYIHNPSGGFWGFWWQGINKDYYFQIEKVQTKYKSKKYIYALCIKVKQMNLSERKLMYVEIERNFFKPIKFRKPIKFAQGKSMTIAVFDGEFPKTINNRIDMSGTIGLINTINNVMYNHAP